MEDLVLFILQWGCIAVAIGVPLIILCESFTDWLAREKRNRKFVKTNGRRLRRKCVDCPYCRKKLYRPFHTPKFRNLMVAYVPTYCRKFRVPLNRDDSLRCISKEASLAMYEEAE